MFDFVLKYILELKNVDENEHDKVLLDTDCNFLLKVR